MALFDPREMLKMAIMDEETGISFYKALAAIARRPDVQSQCIAIAGQEEVHATRFKKMLDALGDYRPAGEEYAGQHEAYLQALLESRTFLDPNQAAEGARAANNDGEAVDIAMRFEKDALAFLLEVREVVPPANRRLVKAVIDEERHHLVELARLRQTLI